MAVGLGAINGTVEITGDDLKSLVFYFKDARNSQFETLTDFATSIGHRQYIKTYGEIQPNVQGSMRFTKIAWREIRQEWVYTNLTVNVDPIMGAGEPVPVPIPVLKTITTISDSHWTEALLLSVGGKKTFRKHFVVDFYAGMGFNCKFFTKHPHHKYRPGSLAFTAGTTVGLTY